MKLPLKYYGDEILRKKCSKIENITEEIIKLAHDMIETMDYNKGVGLSANQVGKDIMMLVMRPLEKDKRGEYILGNALVYINPLLSNPSLKKVASTEGCLSFPGIHVEVLRPYSIHVEAIDLEGKKISRDLEGFEARCVMHENDHLNGKYFIDRISKKEKEKIKEILKNIKKRKREFS